MHIAPALLALGLGLGLARFRPDDALPEASPQITAAELRHHVAFLASDELRGRDTGTPELRRAALYLARSLERGGVAPADPRAAGPAGYLQPVPLQRVVWRSAPELEVRTVEGEPLEALYGRDFSVQVRGEARSTATLSLLVVDALEALPEAADPSRALLLDGSRRERQDWLEARGLGQAESFGLYLRLSARSPGEPLDAPRPGRWEPWSEPQDGPDPCDVLSVRGALREAIEAGRVATLRLSLAAERERTDDQNVVGILRGVGTAERPELADEVLVLSAHYDHIGIDEDAPEDADRVYNGADDDASGTAVVLAIAEALAAGPPPARTVVFLLATGEEHGLLGTRWYLDHPVLSLEQTVCNLNFEMLGRPDALAGGPGKLWLTGFELTNLGPRFQQAGLAVVPDPHPEQHFYQRSDNYAFVRRGIVGQTLSSYGLHEDYHRVSDELDTLDLTHLERVAQEALAAVQALASGTVTPSWTEPEGDEEGEPTPDAAPGPTPR